MRWICVFATLALVHPAFAQKKDWYETAVKKVEATFEPAEAKPGQTVTYRLTVHLNAGFYTYPTRQADKAAEAMVNKLVFPASSEIEFVGDVLDPKEFKSKAEPLLGIKDLHIVDGKVVYERKAVVAQSARPGKAAFKLTSFTLNVCDELNCYPSKKLTPEASLTVLPRPPE